MVMQERLWNIYILKQVSQLRSKILLNRLYFNINLIYIKYIFISSK